MPEPDASVGEGRTPSSGLALGLLAAVVAVVPVVTANLTGLGIGARTLLYDATGLPRLVVALVGSLAAAAAWLSASRGRRCVKANVPLLLLVALAVWAAASAAFSPHARLAVLGQSERLEGAVTYALYALLYALGLHVVSSERRLRVVAGAFGAASALLAVYGLLQYAGFDPASYLVEGYGFDLRRAFATTGNPNFLGGVLVLAFPLVTALALTAGDRARSLLWSASAVTIAGALFATFTRGAWLAMLLEVVAGVVVLRRGVPGVDAGRAARLAMAGAAFIALLAAASLLGTGETSVLGRLSSTGEEGGSASERSMAAAAAVSMARQRPLLGYGPDAYLPAFRLLRSDAYAKEFTPFTTINNAHSWPLQAAATTGVPGALLLVAAVGSALWLGRRSAKGEVRLPLAAAAWIACGGFVLHMVFSVAVLASTVPFWVLLGVLGAPSARRLAPSRGALIAAACLFVLMTAAALAWSGTLLVADRRYLASRVEFNRGRYDEAERLAVRASSLNPLSVKYARGAAEAAGASILEARGEVEVRERYERAAALYERALDLEPGDYPALARYAALQARAGTLLGDGGLTARAAQTARRAQKRDRQASQVRALASGEVSERAIAAAEGVQRLP